MKVLSSLAVFRETLYDFSFLLRQNCNRRLPARCFGGERIARTIRIDHSEREKTVIVSLVQVSRPYELLQIIRCHRANPYFRRRSDERFVIRPYRKPERSAATVFMAEVQLSVLNSTGSLARVRDHKTDAFISIALEGGNEFGLRRDEPWLSECQDKRNCREKRDHQRQCGYHIIELAPPTLSSLAMLADGGLSKDRFCAACARLDVAHAIEVSLLEIFQCRDHAAIAEECNVQNFIVGGAA